MRREKGSEVSTVEVGTDSEHLMLGLKTLESKMTIVNGLGELHSRQFQNRLDKGGQKGCLNLLEIKTMVFSKSPRLKYWRRFIMDARRYMG